MSNCLVSICIPAYNEPDFLESALLSCLSQSFSDFEIIICDDSSTDLVERVVEKYLVADGRIRYYRNHIQLGAADNSNMAVKHAKGDWIKFLYQDDTFACDQSLQYFVDHTFDCEFIISPSIWRNDCGSGIHQLYGCKLRLMRRDPLVALLRYGNIIGAPSATMIKKSLLMPFEERMTWLFDLTMYAEVLSLNPKFTLMNDPAIVINMHSRQLTHAVSGSDSLELSESLLLFNKISLHGGYVFPRYRFVLFKMLVHGSRLSLASYISLLDDAGFRKIWSRPFWAMGVLIHTLNRAVKHLKTIY